MQGARYFAQTNSPPIRSLATKRFDLNLPRVGARLEAGCAKLWGDRDAGSATRGIFRRLAGVAGGATRPDGAGDADERGKRRRAVRGARPRPGESSCRSGEAPRSGAGAGGVDRGKASG